MKKNAEREAGEYQGLGQLLDPKPSNFFLTFLGLQARISMKRLMPLFWMSLGLVSLTLSIILISDLMVGLIPDPSSQILTFQQKYSEAMAVQYSILAQREDDQAIQQALDLLVERNVDIQSVALILESGETAALAGPHQNLWIQPSGTHSTPDHIPIPIFTGDRHWGNVTTPVFFSG